MGNPRTDWMMRTEAEPGLNGRVARLSARQGARRLHRDQRHDLHARPGGRLRPLAPARQCRLGLGRRAALLPPIRGQLPRRDRRCTAPAANGRSRASGCAGTSSRRSATRPRRSASRRRDDFNDGDNEGSGYFEVNQRERHPLDRGARPSSGRRDGGRTCGCVTGALVTGLALDGRRATGVRYRAGRRRAQAAAADGEVILAAGAINSPKLLELSGHRRPGRARARTASPVAHALPGVGANLQDHLQIRTVFRVTGARTLNQLANSLVGKAAMAAEYALFRRGPLSMAPSQLGIFSRSDETVATADLEYHIQPLSTDKLGDPLHP